MFGAIAGGIASALAGGAMSKLFGGGQKAASGGIQGDVLATDNNTVGMGDAGIKSAIQGSNVPNPDEAVPSFVSGAMAKAGKGLLEGTLQAGTSAVSDKLLDLVGLGGKSAADKGKDTRDYLAAAFPELNAWERAGADASSAGMVDAGFENQKELSSGKVRPNHETNINIIARRTGKDVNSHTVLDGIITTIMATIQRINIIGSREGSRNRRRLKANQTGKKFRVGIKSNISTNRNNLISGVDRCIHLNAMKKTTITSINRQTIKI